MSRKINHFQPCFIRQPTHISMGLDAKEAWLEKNITELSTKFWERPGNVS